MTKDECSLANKMQCRRREAARDRPLAVDIGVRRDWFGNRLTVFVNTTVGGLA